MLVCTKFCPLDRHDASFLTFFFTEIWRLTNKTPALFITDFRKALLIAIARAFAKCSDLKDYLTMCYRHLIFNENKLPGCCLNIDVSHLLQFYLGGNV